MQEAERAEARARPYSPSLEKPSQDTLKGVPHQALGMSYPVKLTLEINQHEPVPSAWASDGLISQAKAWGT